MQENCRMRINREKMHFNERDLEEIDQNVRKQLKFITAQTVDTVLDAALNRKVEINPNILTKIPEDGIKNSRKPALRQ